MQQGVAAGAVLESAGKTGLKWAPEVGWAGLGCAGRTGAAIVAAECWVKGGLDSTG